MGTEKIIFDKAKDIQKEDTRYVTSKLEEEYKLADGTMLEVRKHEFHANEQAAKNYKKTNKNAPVKSMTGKKAKEKLQAQMEELEATKAEWREKYDAGDRDYFILHGKLVNKKDTSSTNVADAMENNIMTLEEARKKAEDLKAKIDGWGEDFSDENNIERMQDARELKKLYTEAGRIEDEASRLAIEKEYAPLCDYILQENEYIFDDKFKKTFSDFRKAAGRTKKNGKYTYTEDNVKQAERNEYQKDEAYYDYLFQLDKAEKQNAITQLGIQKGTDEMEAFDDKFALLKVYHLHRAKEANRKIDLVKWYNAEDTNTDDFLSDELIYAEERVNDTYPLF